MKQYLAISFTLKGQDADNIIKVVEKIASENPNAILINGFMPLDVVNKKGFDPKIAQSLNDNFPAKLDFYDRASDAPLRDEMVKIASVTGAKVYIIGKITDGVAQELELYKRNVQGSNIFLMDCNDYEKNPNICRACRGDGRKMDGTGYVNIMCPSCQGSGEISTN